MTLEKLIIPKIYVYRIKHQFVVIIVHATLLNGKYIKMKYKRLSVSKNEKKRKILIRIKKNGMEHINTLKCCNAKRMVAIQLRWKQEARIAKCMPYHWMFSTHPCMIESALVLRSQRTSSSTIGFLQGRYVFHSLVLHFSKGQISVALWISFVAHRPFASEYFSWLSSITKLLECREERMFLMILYEFKCLHVFCNFNRFSQKPYYIYIYLNALKSKK